MRILVLTTDTLHHTFFVKKLKEKYNDVSVICENKREIKYSDILSKSFLKEKKKFEKLQEKYEVKKWFNGQKFKLDEFCNPFYVENLNTQKSIKLLKNLNPTLIIVFGTGKLNRDFIKKFKSIIFNLHGGDPQNYRGLDSHLWSIYHKDFNSLKTTLHKITPQLDAGEIYKIEHIKLWPNMKLFQLRLSNTETCLKLALDLINDVKNKKPIKYIQQKNLGRYYSLMPQSLKFKVNDNFENYIEKKFI
jgi:methionyl-tRNA formyltransferase